MERHSEHYNDLSCSIKDREFLDYLSDYSEAHSLR